MQIYLGLKLYIELLIWLKTKEECASDHTNDDL